MRGSGMLDAYCVDEVTILKWEGNDSWGEAESATEVEVKGRVYLPRRVERSIGRPLRHEDRIMIGGESFDRTILKIDAPKDWTKAHYEVYLA
jgi:hypothetical protein